MAHHKVGNRYLNDKEYDEHVLELWGLFLFLAGAFITGYFMNGAIPEDWAKMWRFLLIVLPAVIAGFALSFLAAYVRTVVYIGLFCGALAGIAYWVWGIV